MNASEPREDAVAGHDDFAEWLARDWPLYHVNGIVAVRMRSAWNAALDAAIATLAAPKEAGDAHPWARFLSARADAIDWLHGNGETDSYIAHILSMDETQVTLIRNRLAAPSKEAGPGMREALRQCYVELSYCANQLEDRGCKCPEGGAVRKALALGKAALAAPQADQQGLPDRIDWTAGGTRHDYARIGPVSGEVARQLIHDAYQAGKAGIGYTAQIDALHDAAKPSDQQGASLEGDARALVPKWREAARRLDEQAHYVAGALPRAECYRSCADQLTAALATKASPDDQRQKVGFILPAKRENKHGFVPAVIRYNDIRNAVIDEIARLNNASPPTEAEWKIGDRVQWTSNFGARFPATITRINPATYDADLDDGTQAENYTADRFAALSPTASAAREGPK